MRMHLSEPVALQVGRVDRRLIAGDEPAVGVRRRRAEREQRRRVRQDPPDVVPRELRESGVALRIGHQRRAVLPQGLVAVHPRAVVAEEGLRHEGRGLAVEPRDVLDDVLVDHHLVGHPRERPEAHVDLALAAGRDLVMVELARDPERLERHHHLAAQIVQRVRRRRREIALLRPDRVAETRRSRVPVPFGRVDLVVRVVHGQVVGDRVEDEELAFGTEIRGVGEAGRLQVILGALREPARVLAVGRERHRVDHLAEQRHRRQRRVGIEDRGVGLWYEEHVALGDPLPPPLIDEPSKLKAPRRSGPPRASSSGVSCAARSRAGR